MKKYLLKKLLMIAVFVFTTDISSAAAAGDDADVEGLGHLPKSLQRPALDFYGAVEGYYRHAATAGGGDAPAERRPKGTSFYDYYDLGESVLSEPIMAFVDWMIFSNGIGVEEDKAVARISMRKMYNFINPAFVMSEDRRESTEGFLDHFKPLGANPYVQHLRGVFLYCGVGGAPDQVTSHALILEAAKNNYIEALRFLNTISPFDERIEEQKRLKWVLEDLEEPKEFIKEFMRRRDNSFDEVDADLFERLERIIKYCCPGDNEKLWDLYKSSRPKIYDIFKEAQNPWNYKDDLNTLAIFVPALGLSIAWTQEGGLEPILSTTVAGLTLAASGIYYVWNGNFYRTMSWITGGAEIFRERAPMNLSSNVLDKDAKLAALFSVIYFSEKFQGSFPESEDSLVHQIQLIFDRKGPLTGIGSLAKMIFSERPGMFS